MYGVGVALTGPTHGPCTGGSWVVQPRSPEHGFRMLYAGTVASNGGYPRMQYSGHRRNLLCLTATYPGRPRQQPGRPPSQQPGGERRAAVNGVRRHTVESKCKPPCFLRFRLGYVRHRIGTQLNGVIIEYCTDTTWRLLEVLCKPCTLICTCNWSVLYIMKHSTHTAHAASTCTHTSDSTAKREAHKGIACNCYQPVVHSSIRDTTLARDMYTGTRPGLTEVARPKAEGEMTNTTGSSPGDMTTNHNDHANGFCL